MRAEVGDRREGVECEMGWSLLLIVVTEVMMTSLSELSPVELGG